MRANHIRSHRDLTIWQRGVDLVERVYTSTRHHPSDAYDLVRQMRRAAVSVPANIAEGRGRRGTRDFANFLGIARGSLMELDTLVVLAQRLGVLEQGEATSLEREIGDISHMITALQRRLTPFPAVRDGQDT